MICTFLLAQKGTQKIPEIEYSPISDGSLIELQYYCNNSHLNLDSITQAAGKSAYNKTVGVPNHVIIIVKGSCSLTDSPFDKPALVFIALIYNITRRYVSNISA